MAVRADTSKATRGTADVRDRSRLAVNTAEAASTPPSRGFGRRDCCLPGRARGAPSELVAVLADFEARTRAVNRVSTRSNAADEDARVPEFAAPRLDRIGSRR